MTTGEPKMTIKQRNTSRYVRGFTVPKNIPQGRVLMHNHVIHGQYWPCGINGFRAWTDIKPTPGFVLCPCGYADLKHYALEPFVAAYRKDPQGYKEKVRALEAEWFTAARALQSKTKTAERKSATSNRFRHRPQDAPRTE
jgi:hypothetical protein